MPGKKKSSKKSSPKNTATIHREPEKLSHQDRYQGYDEERSDFNPAHQADYDVDENDIDHRSGKYKDDGGTSARAKQ